MNGAAKLHDNYTEGYHFEKIDGVVKGAALTLLKSGVMKVNEFAVAFAFSHALDGTKFYNCVCISPWVPWLH